MRTVAVSLARSEVPEPALLGAVRAAFSSEFGVESVEECAVPEPYSGVIYVQLATTCIDVGGLSRTGAQCAHDAVETLDEQLVTPAHSSRVCEAANRPDYMYVRPAVVNGLLWVGEVPVKANEDALRDALRLLDDRAQIDSITMPKDPVGNPVLGWALVKYRSDEEAAEVLVRSRSSMVSMSQLPWPLVIEAFAPNEQHASSFLLSLQQSGVAGQRTGQQHPPHFVSHHTLEFEFSLRWVHLYLYHSAQREAMRKQHWQERHLAMANVRPADERDKWRKGANSYSNPEAELNRSIYVLGVPATMTKDEVKKMFSEYANAEVERCRVHERDQPLPNLHAGERAIPRKAPATKHASVRYTNPAAAWRVLKFFLNPDKYEKRRDCEAMELVRVHRQYAASARDLQVRPMIDPTCCALVVSELDGSCRGDEGRMIGV